jgi:site-specific recombinase XerD
MNALLLSVLGEIMSYINRFSDNSRKPKLLDQVRLAIRARHYSIRTEEAYVQWIKRFILFHHKRHPKEMGADEVSQSLSDLAVQRHVAASTQNQALSAILFLYQEVLKQDIGWLDNVVRAKKAKKLPVVLTREEVKAVVTDFIGQQVGHGKSTVRFWTATDGVHPLTCKGRRLLVQSHCGQRREGG